MDIKPSGRCRLLGPEQPFKLPAFSPPAHATPPQAGLRRKDSRSALSREAGRVRTQASPRYQAALLANYAEDNSHPTALWALSSLS